VKTNKTERDFLALPHLQKQLLLGAVDSVKTGGHVVYSTCSVTVEENEGVVQYLLRKRPNVKIVDSGLTFGVEGFTSYMGKTFDQKMKLSRRYCKSPRAPISWLLGIVLTISRSAHLQRGRVLRVQAQKDRTFTTTEAR
jgi:hypothetical protein